MARLTLLLALLMAIEATAACSAASGASRVALLELYTSEGCDSCPPADRWLSSLADRNLSPHKVVTLGFHVDYWNYLGWKDPFARAEFSERQRTASRRNQARVVYTPQVLLNGKDYRRGTFVDDIDSHVSNLSQHPAKARITLFMSPEPGALAVTGTATVPDAAHRTDSRTYVALYENNLFTHVMAGENKGKRLRHDFVVRELAGPYPADQGGAVPVAHRFRLEAGWKPADLHIAAFVQNERNGEVLQALAMRGCP